MIRRPPRSTQGVSSAASDVYKRQCTSRARAPGGSVGPSDCDRREGGCEALRSGFATLEGAFCIDALFPRLTQRRQRRTKTSPRHRRASTRGWYPCSSTDRNPPHGQPSRLARDATSALSSTTAASFYMRTVSKSNFRALLTSLLLDFLIPFLSFDFKRNVFRG